MFFQDPVPVPVPVPDPEKKGGSGSGRIHKQKVTGSIIKIVLEMAQKSSNIWNYFAVNTKESYKESCNICNTVIGRGPMNQSTKFSTSLLIKHLKYKQHSIDDSNFNENNLSAKA
jgi:hypothetical protein